MSGLSVCMIVRDEATRIARCIASVSAVADQICVVDTGSIDATEEIARDLGAEVRRIAWSDDFSVARNASLEMATHEWILVIDADEELTPSSTAPLLSAMARPDAAFLVHQDNLRDDGSVHSLLVPRLFRNRPDIRFSRPVHESIMESLEQIEEDAPTAIDLHLRHDGYLAETLARVDKVGRNARLLRRHVTREPLDLYGHYKLAATLSRRDDRSERGRHLQTAIAIAEGRDPDDLRTKPYLPALVSDASRFRADTGQLGAARDLVQWGLHVHPGSPELTYQLADVQRRLGESTAAVDGYKKTVALPRGPAVHAERAGLRDALPLLGLSRVLASHGDPAKAHELCVAVIKHAPHRVDARCERVRRLLALGDARAAAAALSALTRSSPRHPEVELLIGDVAWARGDGARAVGHWSAVAPGSAPAFGETEGHAVARAAIAALCSEDRHLAAREIARLGETDVRAAACKRVVAKALGQAVRSDPAFYPPTLSAHEAAWSREIASRRSSPRSLTTT